MLLLLPAEVLGPGEKDSSRLLEVQPRGPGAVFAPQGQRLAAQTDGPGLRAAGAMRGILQPQE